MNIYTNKFPSTKAMPYVYCGYNSTSGESYIGYHMNNVKKNIPSSSDLGVIYFTSSKYIKPRFHEFDWTIVAEFFDDNDAYDFEQLLIFESWKLPGTLNKHCTHGKPRFNTTGVLHGPRVPHSDNAKLKMSIASKGKPKSEEHKLKMSIAQSNRSDETKLKMSIANKGKSNGPPLEETKLKITIANKGKHGHPRLDETKLKISIARKGVPQPVVTCPHCLKSGGISGMKQHHFSNCKNKNKYK